MTVLPIPGSLTNQTWTAPSGTYTMPGSKTACHGAVTVDLSACNLIDGGGTGGLLTVSADSTSLQIIGAGAPTGTGRGPLVPSSFTYVTSAAPSAFVNMVSSTNSQITFTGFTSDGLPSLITGQTANPASAVFARGVFSRGLAVGIETYASIDVDNCVLRGGGANTNPVGLHFFQFQGASPPSTRALWVPGTYLRCTNSEISGFVSSATTGFLQGDAMLAESSCEYVYIFNVYAGGNSDSGILDSKACYGEVSFCETDSYGARAISQHCMGDGRGPWNGIYSHDNTYRVLNASVPVSGGFTECFQAEGIIKSVNDTVVLVAGSRLAVTAFGDSPGSGAPGSYPRLGSITMISVHDASGTYISGPNVKGDDATHATTIIVNNTGLLQTRYDSTGLSDANYFTNYIDTRNETLTITDANVALTQSKIVSDPASPTDSIILSRNLVFTDLVGSTDPQVTVALTVGQNSQSYTDLLNPTDAIVIDRVVTFNDPIGLKDSTASVASSATTFTDPEGVTDTIALTIGKFFAENVAPTDADVTIFSTGLPTYPVQFDYVENLTDTLVFNQSMVFGDNVGMIDVTSLDYPRAIKTVTINFGI